MNSFDNVVSVKVLSLPFLNDRVCYKIVLEIGWTVSSL